MTSIKSDTLPGCPLCGDDGIPIDTPGTHRVFACIRCGLHFSDPHEVRRVWDSAQQDEPDYSDGVPAYLFGD